LEAKLQDDESFAWRTFTNDKYVINRGEVEGSVMCKQSDSPADACGLNMVKNSGVCECIEGWVPSESPDIGCVRGCHAWSSENSPQIPIMYAGDIIENTSLNSFCNSENQYSKYDKLYCDAKGKVYGKEYSVHIDNKSGFTPLDKGDVVSKFCLPCGAGKKFENDVCVNCPAGTHSQGGDVNECEECLPDTYSSEGAENCTDCDGTDHSLAGAEECYPLCKGIVGWDATPVYVEPHFCHEVPGPCPDVETETQQRKYVKDQVAGLYGTQCTGGGPVEPVVHFKNPLKLFGEVVDLVSGDTKYQYCRSPVPATKCIVPSR
jgi:hypothetical protein